MQHSSEAIDAIRLRHGFMSVSELLELTKTGNSVLDPYSTLVAQGVRIGRDNVIYPGVTILCDSVSACVLGSGNTLWPSTLIIAADGGSVDIGDDNSIGQGGTQIKANRSGAHIDIGSRTRLINGPELLGGTTVCDGCQVLGSIVVQSTYLGGGADHTAADPDRRGAVLKGSGLARGLTLDRGEVLNGSGEFRQTEVERQRAYHPDAPTEDET
ncbi:hypothetical protein ACFV2B_11160 [Streptomyces lavendulae]|uniref:hypothetical protein n=1 Tax=Streptomyces lavendulae TaxID=1914 RepID=UPI0036CD6ED0